MAIGSKPEYGIQFETVTESFDWKLWREMVGDDLCGGYAKVIYISLEERERNLQVYALRQETESAESTGVSAVASVQSDQS